uniref:PHD-type domain-containing protein n=1 Tax=Aplanochytrium stocchinoi TaxID=215587 RepID=A0A7S3LRH0_9STRA
MYTYLYLVVNRNRPWLERSDVVIGIGIRIKVGKSLKTRWFDLRPLNFVEGFALLKSILRMNSKMSFSLGNFAGFVIKVQRNLFPESMGCTLKMAKKVKENQQQKQRCSNGVKEKQKVQTAKSRGKRTRPEVEDEGEDEDGAVIAKAKKLQKSDAASSTTSTAESVSPEDEFRIFNVTVPENCRHLGLMLATTETLKKQKVEESQRILPLWIPVQYERIQFAFVTAVYDSSCLKDEVKPGDVLLKIDDTEAGNLLDALKIITRKLESDSPVHLFFGRPVLPESFCGVNATANTNPNAKINAFSPLVMERFNRNAISGGSGYCLANSPLVARKYSGGSPATTCGKKRESKESNEIEKKMVSPLYSKRSCASEPSTSGTPLKVRYERFYNSRKIAFNIQDEKQGKAKNMIRVGKEYQADIPDSMRTGNAWDIWHPNELPDSQSTANYVNGAQVDYGHSIESALQILFKNNYDIASAVAELSRNPIPPNEQKFVGLSKDTSTLRTSAPILNQSSFFDRFNVAMFKVGKRDFKKIHMEMRLMGVHVPIGSVIYYYYSHWKFSNAYETWRLFVRSRVESPQEFHNDICEACNQAGEVICCDSCNLVFHNGCLNPPLIKIPEDDWSCPVCVEKFSSYTNGALLKKLARSYVSRQDVLYD